MEGPSVSCLHDQSWREARKELEKNLFTLSLESFTLRGNLVPSVTAQFSTDAC